MAIASVRVARSSVAARAAGKNEIVERGPDSQPFCSAEKEAFPSV